VLKVKDLQSFLAEHIFAATATSKTPTLQDARHVLRGSKLLRSANNICYYVSGLAYCQEVAFLKSR